MANRIPSRLKIDNSKFEMYSELRKKLSNKIINSDVFALALAYGYDSGCKIALESKKDFILMSSCSRDLNSLILLIGLTELGEDVVDNPSKMYELAEEYANGGIDKLYKEFKEYGDEFNMKMYDDFMDIHEKFDFNLDNEV